MDTQQLALQRGAEIEQVAIEQLAIAPWKGKVQFKQTLWVVRNTEIEPPQERLIAVNESGTTLWLNNPYDSEELATFWRVEELTQKLSNTPKILVETLLELRYNGLKVLENLADIEDVDEEEYTQAIKPWEKNFTPPQIYYNNEFKIIFCNMIFWTWSYRTGHLERWQVEIKEEKINFERQIIASEVGTFLPYL